MLTEKDKLSALSTQSTWEPRRRINNTLKKLQGVHPVTILMDELMHNQHVLRHDGLIDAFYHIINHHGSISATSSKNVNTTNKKIKYTPIETKVSVGDQIQILLNISTDPDVLVRQYIGLYAWI